MVLEIIHKHSPHRERFTSKLRIPDILYIAMDCFAQDNVLVTVIAHCESNASVQQAEKGYNCADERNSRIIHVLQLQVLVDAPVKAIPIGTTIRHNFRNIRGIEVISVGHILMMFGWQTLETQMRAHSLLVFPSKWSDQNRISWFQTHIFSQLLFSFYLTGRKWKEM